MTLGTNCVIEPQAKPDYVGLTIRRIRHLEKHGRVEELTDWDAVRHSGRYQLNSETIGACGVTATWRSAPTQYNFDITLIFVRAHELKRSWSC